MFRLKDLAIIDIFTDGSLHTPRKPGIDQNRVVDDLEKISMGAGFVIQQDESLFSFAKIKNWPSSTRAELAAIFLALLTVPEAALINIHTDSLCAIQAIQQFRHTSARNWLKSTNSLWLLHIDYIIREKNLNVQFNKIKRHSGIRLNDRADELATLGRDSDRVVDINFNYSNHRTIKFFPSFFNYPIDISFVNLQSPSSIPQGALNGPF